MHLMNVAIAMLLFCLVDLTFLSFYLGAVLLGSFVLVLDLTGSYLLLVSNKVTLWVCFSFPLSSLTFCLSFISLTVWLFACGT